MQSLESAPESSSFLSADSAATAPPSGPWIMTCSYCNWNSSEIDIKFDKPQGIFAQLARLRHGEDHSKHSATTTAAPGEASPKKADNAATETARARFSALKSFYAAQNNLNSSNSSGLSGIADYGFNSPGALSRIMNLYSGNSVSGVGLKPKPKASTMREADAADEGFRVSDLDEDAAVAKLRSEGWAGTVTGDQAQTQVEEGARFTNELWPIPYLLRTKRSKRCPVCRHIISKPESKVGNTRWRIRLVANNSIPSLSIKALTLPSTTSSFSSNITPYPPPLNTSGGGGLLKPLQPAQFLLTFKNLMFDEVKVTLATPSITPGRFASRVTVLCPEFHIDANTDTDMYLDDVLKDGDKDGSGIGGAGGTSGVVGGVSSGGRRRRGHEGAMHQAEAGKVWERGRNWVSIVVEVIPASLRGEEMHSPTLSRKGSEPFITPIPPNPNPSSNPAAPPPLSPDQLGEDEDVLEIPMFVRLEWEGDVSQDQVGTTAGKEKDSKEKKELAYWCVIGIGRISQE